MTVLFVEGMGSWCRKVNSNGLIFTHFFLFNRQGQEVALSLTFIMLLHQCRMHYIGVTEFLKQMTKVCS
jgi:hypothetical protein